ncbi:4-hydroxy-3-methylbut-2-enyl diphosphate reductase [Enterococcus cecorum]|uniref:4-hydroxy-3-methylbut-2-enyl diphosphate reductase n=1 Tax=Enterococcus cecorum TaxID=44008 RepID=UPI001FAE21FC|nr:4-hydroxy-3-methylbut-2-enyl diphosphate reductase [Enterococcus cecorum]MCJ0544438.1 4-hydroxy-3-methylbut-2-enyl diphosphate reductase [Enterococcus cecorum]MCJ0548461.1 4-hydroxy-3-methylbut-2-enyl diphosphate reductase [Enterococcus cecorum]
MKLWQYVGKKVKVILEDNTVIIGVVEDWNDGYTLDGYDEIIIKFYAYAENEIVSIEVID